MTVVLHALAVLCIGAVGAVPWARWAMHCASRNAARAANADALIHLCSAAAVVTITGPLYSVPFAAGGWLGTYLSVRKAGSK